MSNPEILDLDLTDPALYRHGFPHEVFTDLRQRGRVFRHPRVTVPRTDREIEFWAVVSHAEVQQASRDSETFSSRDGHSIVPVGKTNRGKSLISMDPPDHTRMRRLINAGFTPRMIAQLEHRIHSRTTKLLDEAAARGEVDFVSEVAFQLPMHVIADILGIPEDDRQAVFQLADDYMWGALDPEQGTSMDERREAERGLFRYANQLSAEKRANPTDDVWSILANGELAELELDFFFIVLSLAGSETTRGALSQGLLALVANPDQLALLREDPSLVPGATEEVLRWSSPVICFGRTVTRDVDLGGQQLSAGDRIGIFYPSANRDESVFENPFRFDVRRSPNPHLSFGGGGPHFCLGASLARAELRVMFGELARRFESIQPTAEPTWVSVGPVNNVGVAVKSLPVRLSERARPRHHS